MENPNDFASAVVMSVLSSSPLTSPITAFISEWQQKQQVAFSRRLEKRILQLEHVINHKFIYSDEFIALSAKSIYKIMMDLREEKAHIYADFLAASTLNSNSECDSKFMFLETLDKVDLQHLVFLKKIDSKNVNLSSNEVGWIGSDDEIRIFGLTEPVFKLYCDYLSSIGLIMKLNHFEMNHQTGHLIMQEHYVCSEYGKALLKYLGSINK